MYERHFGLARRPFRATADTEYYYPATTHERSLARLLQGLGDGEGLVLLTGAPGMGKTMLCHRLLESLGPQTTAVFLTNSHFGNRIGLLQALLYDLSLSFDGRGEQELRLTLTDWLLQNYAAGRRAIFVIDEAQHLRSDLLEELRLLSNLEGRESRAVQVVLAGQSRLLDMLRRPELACLNQRLAVRTELEPLDVHEAADYLVHHLRSAGNEGAMTDEALEILARGTGGVPRLLGQAAHQALVLACTAGNSLVDAEAALEALAGLGLDIEPESEESKPRTLNVADPGSEAVETTTLPGLRVDAPEEVGQSAHLFEPTRRPA